MKGKEKRKKETRTIIEPYNNSGWPLYAIYSNTCSKYSSMLLVDIIKKQKTKNNVVEERKEK